MADETTKPQVPEDKPLDEPVQYGFGHPAHRPDPAAAYGFDAGKWRTLPTDVRRRWRVPG